MLAQVAIALLSAEAAITAIVPDPNTKTKYLFVFGDSFTFTNFSIDGAKPSPSNPMGNPPPPGDTFCGGLAWPGYLATEFNTSVTLTFNFASPGSTVDAAIVPPWKSDRLSLVDQFNNWAKSVQSKPAYAPWTPENALFATWIGINDLFNTFMEPEDQAAVVNRVLDGYFARLGTLYAQGARHFALLNVPRTFDLSRELRARTLPPLTNP